MSRAALLCLLAYLLAGGCVGSCAPNGKVPGVVAEAAHFVAAALFAGSHTVRTPGTWATLAPDGLDLGTWVGR